MVIQVTGTSFNPLDAAIRSGLLRQVFPVAVRTAELRRGRVITEVGEGVRSWRVGDAVVGFLPVRTVRVFARSDPAQLTELVARVAAGDLKIDVAELRR